MTTPTTVHAGRAPVGVARFDLYSQTHKALRACMSHTLGLFGRLDADDSAATKLALDELDALLDHCGMHLANEDRFVHPAIEACQAGASQRVAGDHDDHRDDIASLRVAAERMAVADAAQRGTAATALYRELAVFVADNLLHMAYEERAHNALLWAHYGDTALAELHAAIVAATAPADLPWHARWLALALCPAELRELLAGLHASMPAEVFAQVAALLQPHLPAPLWPRLAAPYGLASARSDTQLAERFIEDTFVRFDGEAAAALVTPDFVGHPWLPFGLPSGPDAVRLVASAFGMAFAEASATIVDRLVDGDRVALRYLYAGRHVGELFGLPATGRAFRFEGIAILRLSEGRVAEFWREEDMLGLQRQLGVASLIAVDAQA